MAQKILVTKPTKNALTATSPNDFYLHSDYPLLKVHASGTFSTGITGLKTITHSLGYRPFVLVFSEFVDTFDESGHISTGIFYQHDWNINGASVTYFGYTKIYANTISINIGNTNVTRMGVVKGIYYIFKDEI